MADCCKCFRYRLLTLMLTACTFTAIECFHIGESASESASSKMGTLDLQ